MPVHAHDGAEGLEPEGMGQPPQELVAAIVVHDRLANNRAERGHTHGQPWRYASAMKGKISATCSLCHCVSFDSGRTLSGGLKDYQQANPQLPAIRAWVALVGGEVTE